MSSNIEWSYIDEFDPLKTHFVEIHHVAAYVFSLRNRWRLANLQTAVPARWLRLLALQCEKCAHEQVTDCPLQGLLYNREITRAQSSENPRVSPTMDPSLPPSCESSESEVPEISDGLAFDAAVSEIFAYTGRESGVSTSIARLFASIPGCKLERDPNHTYSPRVSTTWPLDFMLFSSPSRSGSLESQSLDITLSTRPSVMLWMKGPAYWRHQADTRLQESSPARLREDMASHAGPHLSSLVACWTESTSHLEANVLPEWLVLFGVIHDADHVRIVAHIPFRGRHAPHCYLSYLVDELSFGAPLFPQGSATCGQITDRLRVLLAFVALRRHVGDLRRLLFGTEPYRDEAFTSVKSSSSKYSRCSSHHKTPSNTSVLLSDGSPEGDSEYSSCRSSVLPRVAGLDDETAYYRRNKWRPLSRVRSTPKTVNHSSDGHLTLCTSSASCCSSFSSLSDDISSSSYEYSERSRSGSRWSGFMEPSTSSLYQADFGASEARLPDPLYSLRALDNGRRAEIVAWIEGIHSTQPPEDDTYFIALEC